MLHPALDRAIIVAQALSTPGMKFYLIRHAAGHRRSVSIAAAALCLVSCGAPEAPANESAGPPGAGTPVNESAGPPPSEPPANELAELPGLGTPAPLTEEGWGPIRIGMTRAEVVAAAGEDANPDAVGGAESEQCDEFRPLRAPEGMLVMIERDRLTRITLSAGTGITTERGFGVGDAAGPIKEAYGDAAVNSPHKYAPAPAEYITAWKTDLSGDDARGLVYEIGSDGRVAHIHAGGPSIQYVEGCL